jgi:hypothetical protein
LRLCYLTRWAAGALAALGLWFAALIALTITAEPTRAVVLFAPDRTAMMTAVAAADVALLDGSDRMMNVAGASPGFVAKLYAAGAWLVLPSRASGCITPPPPAAARSQARG